MLTRTLLHAHTCNRTGGIGMGPRQAHDVSDCVAVCCSVDNVLQCVAVCSSVLQCVAMCCRYHTCSHSA